MTQRFLVIAHRPGGIARIEHARGGGAGGNAGDHVRTDMQFRLDHVPETCLPPAAIAAAGEYDLIEHRGWFLRGRCRTLQSSNAYVVVAWTAMLPVSSNNSTSPKTRFRPMRSTRAVISTSPLRTARMKLMFRDTVVIGFKRPPGAENGR